MHYNYDQIFSILFVSRLFAFMYAGTPAIRSGSVI